jgi:hypothetical protein
VSETCLKILPKSDVSIVGFLLAPVILGEEIQPEKIADKFATPRLRVKKKGKSKKVIVKQKAHIFKERRNSSSETE